MSCFCSTSSVHLGSTKYLEEILASSLWTELSALLIFKCNYCQKPGKSPKFHARNEFPLPSSNTLPLSVRTGRHAGRISSRLLMPSNKPSVPNQAHCEASQKPTISSPHQRKHTGPTNSKFWPKHGQKLAGNSPSVPLKPSIGPCESYQQGHGQMAIIILMETLYNNWPWSVLPEKAGRDLEQHIAFSSGLRNSQHYHLCRNTALPPRSLTADKRIQTKFSTLMQSASLWHIITTTSGII